MVKKTAPEDRTLPVVFPVFDQAGIRPRRGNVTMIYATPASLKSMLMLYWAARMNLATLVFSADTDEYETTKRAAAMVTGRPQSEVEADWSAGRQDEYLNALEKLNIRWVFESDPTYRDLELETAAFHEAYGEFPQVIVVDNLMNVVPEQENEWAGMRDTTKALKRLVRITDAAVFVLHHASETEKDNTKPPSRNRIQGKVSQLPEVILSIARDGNELRIAAVKNRYGPGDASGEKYVTLWTDPTRCRFYGSRWHFENGIAI
ncbi:MAG TPA: AAA family ATPase [Acidimicrobiales bacterium]|nr:AAA family ATPase [Acidimicrobiales bacterium]